MKKSVLRQIREKAGIVRGEVETSNTYITMQQSKRMLKALKQNNAKEEVWKKNRDMAQQVCGLKPDEDGFYDYDKIDMTNPIVELTYFLGDPRNRAQTSAHLPRERRDRYLRQHLSEDAVELFWDPSKGAKWDKSGTPWNTDGMTPYYELEFRFSDIRKQMGLNGIRKKQAEQGMDADMADEVAAEDDGEQPENEDKDKDKDKESGKE